LHLEINTILAEGNWGVRSKRTKQILSCFGKITNKSTARLMGVSPEWVTYVWQRAGLDYDDEDFKNGYF
jgi:hypothetical protein